MQDPLPGGDKARESAVVKGAVTQAMRALIVIPSVAEDTIAADLRRCLDGDAIAKLEATHVCADGGDSTAEFVAQHQGQLDRPTLMIAPHVQVAATDARCPHLHHDLAPTGIRRLGDIAYLDLFVLTSEFD